jgi:hypothetical protein
VKLSSANSRNLLRERQRRERAAAQPLRVMYPQFASLKLEFVFAESNPEIVAPTPHLLVMHPPTQGYFVFACPCADCDGDFDLTSAVAELARSREPKAHGNLKCGGQRIRDKNGRAPCDLTLRYVIASGPAPAS